MPEYRVDVDHLHVGVFIRLELGWFQHPFPVNRFKIKSQDQIDTLRQLGLTSVICIPEKSDELPKASLEGGAASQGDAQNSLAQDEKPVVDALWNLKRERILQFKARRRKFMLCEKRFQQTVENVKRVMGSLATASEAAVYEASHMIKEIVGSFMAEKDILVHLMNTKEGSDDTYYHSLNTAVLGMILGRECRLDAESMQKLGVGLLFHDVGKGRIEKRILYKRGRLTPPELKLVQLHPQYGQEMLAKVEGFLGESMEIVGSHHESMDGKGYPKGLSGDRIPLLVRIATIADLYDNHCNKPDIKDSLTPYQALSFMFAKQKEELDIKLLSLFVRTLGIYPPGTIVELSNGNIGMVVSANSKNSLRPSVLLYDPAVPKEAALVFDLEEDPDVSIVKSIHPLRLPKPIHEYLDPRTRVAYFVDTAEAG